MRQPHSLESYGPYYDLIYSWKDYKTEAKKVMALIRKYKTSKGNDLLDVACGTGKHIEQFVNRFHCMGIDLSPAMIKSAKQRLPRLTFKQANMINFDLKKKFDVITCLFSAIGHLHSPSDLKKTMRCFYKHLRPGGVAIIEGWIEPKRYRPGLIGMTTYKSDDISIARLNLAVKRGKFSIIDLHYMIGEQGKPIRYFVDPLTLRLFETKEILDAMQSAGFDAVCVGDVLMEHRKVFVALRP